MLRMNVIRLTLVAVLVLSAITATTAQATEGPFYKLAGARLKAGESREMKGSLASGSKLQLKAGTVTITCTSLKFPKGSKLIGSNGANPGKSEQVIEYEGCSQEGNGVECKIAGNKITTNALKSELGYQAKTRTGKILAFFQPVSGTTVASVSYTHLRAHETGR